MNSTASVTLFFGHPVGDGQGVFLRQRCQFPELAHTTDHNAPVGTVSGAGISGVKRQQNKIPLLDGGAIYHAPVLCIGRSTLK